MRKTLASAVTILAFVAYAFGQRMIGHTGPSTALALDPRTQTNTSPAPLTPFAPSSPQGDPSSPQGVPSSPQGATSYQDGTYTGGVASNQWGPVQVQVTVSGGKISNIQVLQVPQDRRRSRAINSQAVPILESEAVQAQSARVDVVSGATLTSEGFAQSLDSALTQAAVA